MTENIHVQRKIEQLAQKNPPTTVPGSPPAPETRLNRQRPESLTRPVVSKEMLKRPDLTEAD
jgi:hypothetical protein